MSQTIGTLKLAGESKESTVRTLFLKEGHVEIKNGHDRS